MDKNSELDCYLYYMWGAWDKKSSIELFGRNLGEHIWDKWRYYCTTSGAAGAPALLYAHIDKDTRKKIVERAVAHYNN